MQIEPMLPTPVELIVDDEIGLVLASAHEMLAGLRERAARLRAAALELEQRLVEERVDPLMSEWMMIRLRHFLDALYLDTQREVESTIAAARRQAEWTRQGDRSDRALPAMRALVSRSNTTPAIDLRALEAAEPVEPVEPLALSWHASMPTVLVPAPVTLASALVAEPTSAPGGPAIEAPRQPVPEFPVVPAAGSPIDPVVVVGAPFAAPNVSAESATSDSSDATSVEFWPAEHPRRRWRRRPTLSASLVLQVAGVVAAILAVIVHVA